MPRSGQPTVYETGVEPAPAASVTTKSKLGAHGLRGRVCDVARHQLAPAPAAAVREAPDAVIAESAAVVVDLPEMVAVCGRGRLRLGYGWCNAPGHGGRGGRCRPLQGR